MSLKPVTYNIMMINSATPLDPVLCESMKHIFEWANREGLAGRQLSALKFKQELHRTPWIGCIAVTCNIWLKETEYQDYEERMKVEALKLLTRIE